LLVQKSSLRITLGCFFISSKFNYSYVLSLMKKKYFHSGRKYSTFADY